MFKKFPETGFFQRAQQISLRTIEAERVIIQLPVFVEKATKYILNGVRPITQTLEASLDEHTDFGNAQWNLDVSRSSTRLVRVSLLTYDVTQPLISTYFQVKLFKKQDDGIFRKEQWVTITLQELEDLANEHKTVLRGLKI